MENGAYNADQLGQVMQNAKDIAELKAEVTAAHKRIDENDRLTNGIHQLSENIATMALEIKLLTEKFDNSVERMERNINEQAERISVIEKSPFKKWEKAIWIIVTAAITYCVNFIAGKF